MGIGSGIYRTHSTTALLKAGVSQWPGSKVADSWHKDNRRAIGRTGLLPAAFIDYFTRYNDEYGHPAGDKVIQTFADILAGTFKRASDVVARVGGEEFLVLTHDSPTGSCQVLANRALQELRTTKQEHAAAPLGIVTASAGVFHGIPDTNLTLEIALSRVDQILYAAKEAGRDRAMHSDELVNNVRPAITADIVPLAKK